MSDVIENGRLNPVRSENRIESLDLLRGIAVLGILIMNIQAYAMVGAAYQNPYVWGDLSGINSLVWIAGYIFASGKFIAIFSMLFGAGIVLIGRKAEKKGKGGLGLHLSRNMWLIFFGCIHAYLLWYGDILFTYGVCSIPVFFMRKLSSRKLLVFGLLLLLGGASMSVMAGLTMDKWPEEARKESVQSWSPDQEKIDEEIAITRGDWGGLVIYRFPKTLSMQTMVLFFYTGWLVTGLMLIGMGLFKWGVFSGERSDAFYKKGFLYSFFPGMALVIWGVIQHFRHDFAYEYSMFQGAQFNYWGAVLVSFSYVCLIVLCHKRGYFRKLADILRTVGRMALSNYLFQTIICVLLFYGGPGLGLFSKIERWGQILVVFAVWLLLVSFSMIWMKNFRFGPFEWIWRSLTYWRTQPLRKEK